MHYVVLMVDLLKASISFKFLRKKNMSRALYIIKAKKCVESTISNLHNVENLQLIHENHKNCKTCSKGKTFLSVHFSINNKRAC